VAFATCSLRKRTKKGKSARAQSGMGAGSFGA
jgi:hypothetical protein